MSGEVSNQHHLFKGGKAERFALRIRKKTPGPLSHAAMVIHPLERDVD